MPPEPTLETLIENVLLTTKTITTATNVTLTGKSGKGENYMGEIVFASAMDELGCEKYEEALRYILESCHMAEITAKSFESTVEDMRGVLDEAILEKWVKFRAQIEHVTTKMRYEVGGLRVFTHGDSWSNNFMYKYDGEKRVERMKILDWQISGYTSPIMDLSYFLFICAEDLEDLDRLLDVYYASFSNALREMGSDAEMVYSKTQFLDDWRKYARFGIACCPVIFKIQLCQEDEVPDIFAEGNEIAEQFLFQLKDKTKYIARVKNVIQYAVKSGLIE